jgi:hypothetical protein
VASASNVRFLWLHKSCLRRICRNMLSFLTILMKCPYFYCPLEYPFILRTTVFRLKSFAPFTVSWSSSPVSQEPIVGFRPESFESNSRLHSQLTRNRLLSLLLYLHFLPSSDRYYVILFPHACATCPALSILHHLLAWTVISTRLLLLHPSLLHISPPALHSPPHSKLPLSDTPKTCWIVQVKD